MSDKNYYEVVNYSDMNDRACNYPVVQTTSTVSYLYSAQINTVTVTPHQRWLTAPLVTESTPLRLY